MKHGKLIKQAARLAEPFCITKGEKFRLKDYDPSDTTGVKSKEHAQQILDARVGVLSRLQEKLYAQDRWAVLIVLQALDAAGKDGVVKHVMSGVNPQGCEVSLSNHRAMKSWTTITCGERTNASLPEEK